MDNAVGSAKLSTLWRIGSLTLWFALFISCSNQPSAPPMADTSGAEADSAIHQNTGLLTIGTKKPVAVKPEELDISGPAHYRWPDGRTYEGDWFNGQPQGIGTEIRTNGETYTGQWHEGTKQGTGTLQAPNGDEYVGSFVNNLRQGQGKLVTTQGTYEGQWHADLPNGLGKNVGRDGSEYTGSYQSGIRAGEGTYVDRDGASYKGEWTNDAPHGFGLFTNVEGSQFSGRWQLGNRQGYGRLQDASGRVYEGTWVNNKREGFGKESRPDGSIYQGEWVADKRNGQGRESKADSSFHDGNWENNRALGPGTSRASNGIEISGIWNGDSVPHGLLLLPTGLEYAGPLYRKQNTEVSSKLLAWLTSSAQAGDGYSAYLLGKAYTDFIKPTQDMAKASHWLEQAAVANVPDAKFLLAELTLTQARDDQLANAVALLVDAANLDHGGANLRLGELYYSGEHVPKDLNMAQRYLRRAHLLGNTNATNQLAWLLATTSESGIRSGEMAVELMRPIALYFQYWNHLDTLAAAYAARGQFEQAVETQEIALEKLAEIQNSNNPIDLDTAKTTTEQMRDRLKSYRTDNAIFE